MRPHAGPPHGLVNGRDLSDTVPSASGDPTSSLSERTLFHAYRKMDERIAVPCACGGWIESENDWRAIANAVELHNAEAVHVQWRTWREML